MDISLKEYLDTRLEDLDRRLMERFAMTELAVTKAEARMNERLNTMNEFRDALKDQASLMATRVEVDAFKESASRFATRVEVEAVDRSVRELQNAKANLEGRLFMISGSISVAMTLVIWALSRFLMKVP